jgi:hypothetical protein
VIWRRQCSQEEPPTSQAWAKRSMRRSDAIRVSGVKVESRPTTVPLRVAPVSPLAIRAPSSPWTSKNANDPSEPFRLAPFKFTGAVKHHRQAQVRCQPGPFARQRFVASVAAGSGWVSVLRR